MMVGRIRGRHGFTLMEILIASLLVSLVFLAAISVYMNALKSLRDPKSSFNADLPFSVPLSLILNDIAIALDVTKKIGPGVGDSTIGATSKQINLRLDATCPGGAVHGPPYTFPDFPTPGDQSDDSYVHYAFISGGVRSLCNSAVPGNRFTDVTGGDPSLIDNVDESLSDFSLVNPSTAGATGNVVHIKLVSIPAGNAPAVLLETDVAAGSKSKDRA